MKSISVHGIDEEMQKIIRRRAKSEGKSVNRVMKELIAGSLGLDGRRKDNREEFADLCGVWSEEEAKAFLEAIGDLETVDEDAWP